MYDDVHYCSTHARLHGGGYFGRRCGESLQYPPTLRRLFLPELHCRCFVAQYLCFGQANP